jgi:hypothetical protein
MVPDITHTLQRKQELLAKAQKQNALLAELNALDISAQPVAHGENVDALSEPLPTHPLWHRVDRQFWWNEHLSKPFIDAKVSTFSFPKSAAPDSRFTSCIRMSCHSCKGSSRSPLFQFRGILSLRNLPTRLA